MTSINQPKCSKCGAFHFEDESCERLKGSLSSDTPETDAIWKSTLANPSGLDTTRIIKTRKIERERNELREALRKAIIWAESAAAQITDNRADINWSYLEDARKVLSSQNSFVQQHPKNPPA